jgi:glutamate formiminotransferase
MTARILEAVPNFSEGCDPSVIRAIVDAMEGAGAAVLDWSSDADHNRSVVTAIGTPEAVEDAAVEAARVARDRIDMSRHVGVHPRVGALDVLPFVPLSGLSMDEAVEIAHRAGRRIANDLGVPVYFYARASTPPGRTLAELRKGGFEARVRTWDGPGPPDCLPVDWPNPGAHPTAGVVCVGARKLLLAWNLYVRGVSLPNLKEIAAALRESRSGIPGLRALALELPANNELQISMNLENVEESEPMTVFRRAERIIAQGGGDIVRTQVIGLVPDRLLIDAARERLHLDASAGERLLSRRLAAYLAHGRPDGDRGNEGIS